MGPAFFSARSPENSAGNPFPPLYLGRAVHMYASFGPLVTS